MSLLIIVTGGRDYRFRDRLHEELDMLKPVLVIDGGCLTGADLFARDWADENGIMSITVNALWKSHGRAGGPRRNRRMVKLLRDLTGPAKRLVVAFPGGKGTHNCKKEARAIGLEIRTVV